MLPASVVPTKRTEAWWLSRHQDIITHIKCAERSPELLFLGDSITHAWETDGEQPWQQYFESQYALNLGYAGDRTEHLLWRIQHGEVAGLEPKWAVLLIGTNNAGHRLDTPQDIAAGVKAVLDEVQQRLPNTKVLLMAIFPRSRNKSKPMRQRIDATNELILRFCDDRRVYWLDINPLFLTDEGVLLESVMPDLLHPNQAQYWLWAEQIKLAQQSII